MEKEQKGASSVGDADGNTQPVSRSQASLAKRSSLESTATTLPSYSEHAERPPIYNGTGMREGQSASRTSRPRPDVSGSSNPSGVSAAAISAVMATRSSENDKMHSKGPKKVDDWNKDSTFKGKLASMKGSTSKWNYFGADVEQYGNPFKKLGRKK